MLLLLERSSDNNAKDDATDSTNDDAKDDHSNGSSSHRVDNRMENPEPHEVYGSHSIKVTRHSVALMCQATG